MKRTILIIDDNTRFARDFGAMMNSDYEVHAAHSGEAGLEQYRRIGPDVILLDLHLGAGMDGLEVLEKLRAEDVDTPIIVITEHHGTDSAFVAGKLGAHFYTRKVPDLAELFRIIDYELQRVAWKKQMRQERERRLASFIGESAAIREVRNQVEKIAPLQVPVLITGETGTGKEIIANAIHENSGRRNNPLSTINCSNLQPERFESEFFGHEKGSFTGAYRLHRGLFEVADGSSLFMDEIGDLPMDSQPKILRALENKTFQRIGSTVELSSDARLIAATHHDLEAQCRRGFFRQDLYYRLSPVTIHLPPLRQRREDIPLLVDYFVKKYALEFHLPRLIVPADLMDFFQHFPWPGNVRQLQNALQTAVIYSEDGVISRRYLPTQEANPAGGSLSFSDLQRLRYAEAKQLVLEDFQHKYVHSALVRNGWNITNTAAETGMNRATIHQVMNSAGWKKAIHEDDRPQGS